MSTIGVIRDGRFISADEAMLSPAANDLRADYPVPQLSRDYQPYRSPLGTGWIDGRRERREDLARGHCRPQEAGEGLGGVYHNREFAAKRGLDWTPPPAPRVDPDAAPFVRAPVKSKRRG